MRRLVPLLILAIGVLACYIDFLPGAKFAVLDNIDGGLNQSLETKLGLDLRGGFEVRYQTVDENHRPVVPTAAQLAATRDIIENRVNKTGLAEPIIETIGNNEISVQIPGASDRKQIEDLVGATGKLDFVLLPKAEYGDVNTSDRTGLKDLPSEGSTVDESLLDTAQFTGADLDPGGVSAAVDPGHPGYWLINFAFAGTAADRFATWSRDHVNEYFAIVLDGKIESRPYIKSAITGGSGVISGSFTKEQAQNLATILQYGALPYRMMEESWHDIPATLGRSFLNQTLVAGAIGIGLVLLFMLIYYRLPGLVACLALVYYGVTVLAIFRIIPVTLTLAGIAGFVLSVGMAVDANILIFERTKEELRTGKTLASAVEAGFGRAWNSIFDSNVSSLITAGILYFLGSSTIKGFALVLMIGVATSMFTAVTVSRTFLRVIVRQGFVQKAWLFGVTDAEFRARATGGRPTRREARGRV